MTKQRGDHGSREDRVRTPVSGLRQRLRISLKMAGVTAKFRTDHLRDGLLVVMSDKHIELLFSSFDGRHLRFIKKHAS